MKKLYLQVSRPEGVRKKSVVQSYAYSRDGLLALQQDIIYETTILEGPHTDFPVDFHAWVKEEKELKMPEGRKTGPHETQGGR